MTWKKSWTTLNIPRVRSSLNFSIFVYSSVEDMVQYDLQRENKAKLQSMCQKIKIELLHQLDHGKKLLVLDLDRTLFDHKSQATHIGQLMRPGLHEFLVAMSEHYNIAIWSQSSWRRLEMKLTELGLLTHPEYRIHFVMDVTTMFSICSYQKGKPVRHQVKALQLIWHQFTHFGPHNTVHVDDLSRNFALNPKNGIKIRGFRSENQGEDCDLLWLAHYLNDLAAVADISAVNHDKWKAHSIKKNHVG